MLKSNTPGPAEPRHILARHWPRLVSTSGDPAPRRWLLVDVAAQRLILGHGPEPLLVRPVSTARAGINCRRDSGGTPCGVHRIHRKIGRDAPLGAVFVGREPTGRVWHPGEAAEPDDLILTRILTLEGCEEGINRGEGVDSLARFIYIHGTNHEDALGTPVSHGCVRLANEDVRDLFDQVEEGDPVVIA